MSVCFSVVTVGGDGMFHEILNGLIRRTQRDCGIDTSLPDFTPTRPGLTIGVIPAGKTCVSNSCDDKSIDISVYTNRFIQMKDHS